MVAKAEKRTQMKIWLNPKSLLTSPSIAANYLENYCPPYNIIKNNWRTNEMNGFSNVMGYDVLYRVYSNGDVKSVRSSERLKKKQDNNGRNVVSLLRNGIREYVYVDELIMTYFGDVFFNRNIHMIIHKNGIMSDDRYSNLAIATQYNYRQSIADLQVKQEYYQVYNEDTGDSAIFYGSVYAGMKTSLTDNAVRQYASKGNVIKHGPYAGYKIRKAELQPAILYHYAPPQNYNNSR